VKYRRLTLAVILPLALSGCAAVLAGAGIGVLSGAGTYAAIEAGIKIADDVIQVGCATYKGGRLATEVEIVRGNVTPEGVVKARSIEAWGDPVCANPPSSDISTAIWLGTLVGELGALTMHRIEEARSAPSAPPVPMSFSYVGSADTENPSLDGK